MMLNDKVPSRLWDYGLIWILEMINILVSSPRYVSGIIILEYITGETPDIRKYLDLTFYDWITYHTNDGQGELSICQ